MKKVNYFSSICLAALTANAQTTVQGSKFTDNWSIELKIRYYNSCKPQRFLQECPPGFGN